MEVWGIWLTVIGVVAAIGSAVFGWVQAIIAHRSLVDAEQARDDAKAAQARAEAARDEANRIASAAKDAHERAAAAQEELARMKAEEMAVPDWSDPVHVSGKLWRVTNTSKETITVHAFEVKPEGTEGLVNLRTQPDNVYEYGDSFQFLPMRMMGPNAEKITVVYSLESDGEDDRRLLHIPL